MSGRGKGGKGLGATRPKTPLMDCLFYSSEEEDSPILDLVSPSIKAKVLANRQKEIAASKKRRAEECIDRQIFELECVIRNLKRVKQQL